MLSLALNIILMNLFTILVIISEVGQRIYFIFWSLEKFWKFGVIDVILPKKQALLRLKSEQFNKKCCSSSISPDEQYEHVLDEIGMFLYLPSSIPSLLEDDRIREIHDLWFRDIALST